MGVCRFIVTNKQACRRYRSSVACAAFSKRYKKQQSQCHKRPDRCFKSYIEMNEEGSKVCDRCANGIINNTAKTLLQTLLNEYEMDAFVHPQAFEGYL